MAFGFIRKIFSFGSNEAEEAAVAEAQPLPAPVEMPPAPEPSVPDLPAEPEIAPAPALLDLGDFLYIISAGQVISRQPF